MIIEDCLVRGGIWYNIWKPDGSGDAFSSLVFIASFFDALKRHNIIYNPDLPKAILAREKRQTTNLGNGIAIPHPGFDELGDKSGTLISHDTIYLAYPRFPVQWDVGTPVFAVFFICMNSKEKHLVALAELAKNLKLPGVMDALINREPLDPLLGVMKTKKS